MVEENGMVMMKADEYRDLMIDYGKLEELKVSNEMLRKALLQITRDKNYVPKEVRVSRKDFIKMHEMALDMMFENETETETDIYNHNVTVHWHGIYCDCGDGATPSNHIIPSIAGCDEEWDGEEW